MQQVPVEEAEEEGIARSSQNSGEDCDQQNRENQTAKKDHVDIRAKSHDDQRILDQAVAKPHEARREKNVARLNVSTLRFANDKAPAIGQSQHQPDHR